LPPHWIARLNALLDSIAPDQRVIAVKQWHQVLGELRSMSIAIPGSRGLFYVLQEALHHLEKYRPRIRITRQVQDFLEDFRFLAKDIATWPTCIAELVPADIPDSIEACDAAGTGMGGVYFFVDDKGEIVVLLCLISLECFSDSTVHILWGKGCYCAGCGSAGSNVAGY